jgi:predicted amidohydrolase
MPNRIANLASVCLLDSDQYRTRKYVVDALTTACEGTERDLVVLPYMPFLSSEAVKRFASVARRHGTYVALALPEEDAGKTYATSVLLDREGKVVFKYRKTHAFPDDAMALGDDLPVFGTDFGVIGASITTDLYFPEVYERLRMKGAEVLLWHDYPERFRDYSGHEVLLGARAFDSHAHLVAAMYADPRAYITNRYTLGMQGAAWGRSMVLNRVGAPIADTGYADGVAAATVDLDKRKVDPYDPWVQSENKFFVNCLGDRTAFHAVAEAWQPSERPPYAKRKARVAVLYLWDHNMWSTGKRPERMLELLDKAAAMQPDLVLVSENSAKVDDEVGKDALAAVAELARKMNAYIAVGGLRDENSLSIVYVWDRQGEVIFQQSIYWTKGFPEINVFDTDFARIGTHECGDLYTPMIDRTLMLKGAEMILDPSQMWGADGRSNEALLRARALDNGVWVACAHWNTSDPGLRSVIIDPYGQVMASSVFQQEGLIHVDIDFDDRRVYYEGRKAQQPTRGETDIPSYYSEDIPEQKPGWREMVLSRRRPELYGIIPAENEVTRKYRPERGPW